MSGSQANQKKESKTSVGTPLKKEKTIRKCVTVLKKSKGQKSGADVDDSFMRDLPLAVSGMSVLAREPQREYFTEKRPKKEKKYSIA